MSNNIFTKTIFYSCNNKKELTLKLKDIKKMLNCLTPSSLTYQDIPIIAHDYLNKLDYNEYDLQLLYEAAQNTDSFNIKNLCEYIYDNYVEYHIKLFNKVKSIIIKYNLNNNNLNKILSIKCNNKLESTILQLILDNKTTNPNEITELAYNYFES